jgi:DNA-binding beta-propeller fold protein YncE
MGNWTSRSRSAAAITTSLLVVGLLPLAAPAQAAVTGSLKQQAVCFDNVNPDCVMASEISGPAGAAISPDGKNVYVTDNFSDSVSWFSRTLTGALSRDTTHCVGAAAGCVPANGLDGPYAIVVSPDGDHVYAVTSSGNGGVAVFHRTDTGGLMQLAGPDGCLTGSPISGCAADSYITGAQRLAFSPNGLQLYVVTSEGRLVTLTRNPTSGALSRSTTGTCLSANPEPNCQQVIPLAGVSDVAVSSDGKSVYTVAEDESGGVVAQYIRASNGGLLYEDCDGPDADGCSHTAFGLAGASNVVVSPNGRNVYTTGGDAGVGLVAVFHRSTTTSTLGALTQPTGTAKCISNDGTGGACANAHGLGSIQRIAVAPDNRTVYVTVHTGSHGVVVLNRATTGLLTQPAGAAGCINDSGSDGCADGKALSVANGIALSRDGNSVYVAAAGHGGVSGFKRISPPKTTITSGPSGETKDRTPTYKFVSNEAHSTFQCKVDDGAWKSCTSPRTLGKQSFGKHVFKVRARDAVGTYDPTPATRRFKVVRS